MIDWHPYNRSLVRRDKILFSYDFLDIRDSDLELMNKNKKGNKPLVFPNSFILVIGYIRYFFHLPYRQTEGIIKTTGKSLPVNTEHIPKFDKIIALFPLLITVTCIRRMDSVNKNNKHPTILKVPDELWDKI
ncbi:MAG TPA: hypothetical protein VIY08_08800, partial [Candidatus Nitrosocosmicus sp.]